VRVVVCKETVATAAAATDGGGSSTSIAKVREREGKRERE
jgi:hypothetical protein